LSINIQSHIYKHYLLIAKSPIYFLGLYTPSVPEFNISNQIITSFYQYNLHIFA